MSWRRDFDAARDPYTARNALGITGGGGGAPTTAEYITATTDPTLTAERVLTNTASITWDFTTPGQAKASTTAGGGNVSNSGTPTVGQYAKWVTATTIQGVATATVLSDIGAQPLDGDLTAIAALAGTNTIYYRSAANTWTAVTVSTGLTFSGGTLAATIDAPVGAEYITSTTDATLTAERVLTDSATITWDRTVAGQIKASTAAGGGNVSNSGTPTAGQYGKWVTATTIQGVAPATVLSDIGAAASTDFPNGAWTNWTPTVSSGTGTITSSSVNIARYTKAGKSVTAYFDVTIANAGTGAGSLNLSLPVAASASGGGMGVVREIGATLSMGGATVNPGATVISILVYNGGTFVTSGYRIQGSVTYESA